MRSIQTSIHILVNFCFQTHSRRLTRARAYTHTHPTTHSYSRSLSAAGAGHGQTAYSHRLVSTNRAARALDCSTLHGLRTQSSVFVTIRFKLYCFSYSFGRFAEVCSEFVIESAQKKAHQIASLALPGRVCVCASASPTEITHVHMCVVFCVSVCAHWRAPSPIRNPTKLPRTRSTRSNRGVRECVVCVSV